MYKHSLLTNLKYCICLMNCSGVNTSIMDSSPGLVRRRIQEMTTSFQTQNSPKHSPKNSPKNPMRKKFQPTMAKVEPNRTSLSSSSLSNAKRFNSMGAKPYKSLYTATATATITTNKSPALNRRPINLKSVNDSNDAKQSETNNRPKPTLELKNKRVFPLSDGKEDNDSAGGKSRLSCDENNERYYYISFVK